MPLLAVQAVALYIASSRGFDYALRRSDPSPRGVLGVVEQSAPLWVWGALYVGSVAIALAGIAGGWARVVIVGHGLIVCWYAGTGLGVLLGSGYTLSWVGVGGLLASALGAAAVLNRPAFTALWVRLCGVALMLGGQYVLSVDLGPDYRQGFSLLGAAVLHIVCLIATAVLWRRQRLRVVVAAETEGGPGTLRPLGPQSGPLDLDAINDRLGELTEVKRRELRAIDRRLVEDDPP